jgi:hypothetical protein
MDEENIGLNENDYLLTRLKYYLNYELSTAALYFLSYAYGITLFISALAALIFTPVLIYTLYKTRKYFWLTAFLVLVILPPLVVYIYIAGNPKEYIMELSLVELGFFYFYCFILRIVVIDWVEEIKWKSVLKNQVAESEMNKKIFEQQFDERIV